MQASVLTGLEIPVKDSPKTPETPDSPVVVSRSAKGPEGKSSLVSRKTGLDTGGFRGIWRTKPNHGPHRDVTAFKPASSSEAKAFLNQLASQLPPSVSSLSGDTSRSSRTEKWLGRPVNMPCHGCHGPIGGGAHNGSAPGKNICSLVHHPSCPGGIKEDDDYKACPNNYVFQETTMGFEETMSSQDFIQTQTQFIPDPNLSTGSSGQSQPYIPTQQQYGEGLLHAAQEGVHRQSTPGMSQPIHEITDDMQRQMDRHRSVNQSETVNQDRPSAEDLNIRDLRSSEFNLNGVVNNQMAGYREVIPSLFAAPTARVPSAPLLPGSTGALPPLPLSSSQSAGPGVPLSAAPPATVPSAPLLPSGPGAPPAMPSSTSQFPVSGASLVPPRPTQGAGIQAPSMSGASVLPQSMQGAFGGARSKVYQVPNHVNGPHVSSATSQQVGHQGLHLGHGNTNVSANVFQAPQVPYSQGGHQYTPQASQQVPGITPIHLQQPGHVQQSGQQIPGVTIQPGNVPQASQPVHGNTPMSGHVSQANQHVHGFIPNYGQHIGHAQQSGINIQPGNVPQANQPASGTSLHGQHSDHVPQLNQNYGTGQQSGQIFHPTYSHETPFAAPRVVPPQPHDQFAHQQVPQHQSQWQQQPAGLQQNIYGQQQQQFIPGQQQQFTPEQQQQFISGQQQHQFIPSRQPHQFIEGQQHQFIPGQQRQVFAGQPSQGPAFPGQSNTRSGQFPQGPYQNHNASNTPVNIQNVPVMSAPLAGSQPLAPAYDLFVDPNGQTYKVLKQTQQHSAPQTKTEFRCSPVSGRMYTVTVPVETPPPVRKYFEWRCNPQTGEKYQVEIQSPVQPTQVHGQPQQVNVPWSGQRPGPQLSGGTAQSGPGHQEHQLLQGGRDQQQLQSPDNFQQQLQNKVKGIVKLYEGEVTKKTTKPIDFAKKCSAKWAKKVTAETVNLPLFTFGAVSELESSLSGRSESLSDGDFLAKLRHIKNFLEVCCLNSESTDFRGYGWSIAKDYALKVESEVEQNITAWSDMSGGVQTSQLLLAQMDCPRPAKTIVKPNNDKDIRGTEKKERCRSYNTCKTIDKCDYELSHPDKTCILKHECSWCKTNLKQSWKHQEWNCKKK